MSIKEQKRRAKRLYELGWEEDDDYNWRCAECKLPRMYGDCPFCLRCECRGKCEPDDEEGKRLIKEYREKGGVSFDNTGRI